MILDTVDVKKKGVHTIFLAGALFAAAWLADFRLGLGARLYRYGGDWFCADGAVDQIDS